MFTDSPEGPGNEQSRVTRLLIYNYPFLFIDNCSETPRGTTPAFLMFGRYFIVRGNSHPWSISLLMDFSSADEFISGWDDLWFPLSIIAPKSDFRVSPSIIEMVTRPLLNYVDDISPVLMIEEYFFQGLCVAELRSIVYWDVLCAAISAPKSPLNAASILLFLTAALCVLLNEKMVFSNF